MNSRAECHKCGRMDSLKWMFSTDDGRFECEDCHYHNVEVCDDCMQQFPREEMIYNVFFEMWLCADCNTVILK